MSDFEPKININNLSFNIPEYKKNNNYIPSYLAKQDYESDTVDFANKPIKNSTRQKISAMLSGLSSLILLNSCVNKTPQKNFNNEPETKYTISLDAKAAYGSQSEIKEVPEIAFDIHDPVVPKGKEDFDDSLPTMYAAPELGATDGTEPFATDPTLAEKIEDFDDSLPTMYAAPELDATDGTEPFATDPTLAEKIEDFDNSLPTMYAAPELAATDATVSTGPTEPTDIFLSDESEDYEDIPDSEIPLSNPSNISEPDIPEPIDVDPTQMPMYAPPPVEEPIPAEIVDVPEPSELPMYAPPPVEEPILPPPIPPEMP